MTGEYEGLIDNSPKRFVGLKQVLRGITDGTIWCVIVSSDCEEFIKAKLRKEARGKDVEFKKGPEMTVLGRKVGIDVGAAVVGLVR